MQLDTLFDQQDVQNTQPQTPYAVAKMGEATRIIKQVINQLPSLRRQLEYYKDNKRKARGIYSDLHNQHRKILSAFDTVTLSLHEAEQDELANDCFQLRQSLASFNLMTPSYTKLCAVLCTFLASLPFIDSEDALKNDDSEAQTTNNRIIGRLMNNVRMGYYPTCTENLAHIIRGMDIPEGLIVNLLDPCCGCGIALRFMADNISKNGSDCRTYGIELDNFRAEEALTRIDRVGFGSFFQSRISNDAFHAMLLNPPYLSVMTEGGNNTRNERLFLVDSISNLMVGGLLIYIIPHYRLTADIARILCENFKDLSVWKFTAKEFKKFKQIAILGTRQKRIYDTNMAPSLLSLALEPNAMPELSELPTGRYSLPKTTKDVALFKGAIFNETELAAQLGKSKSISRLYQQSALDNTEKRPLLPLSIGQIGLVGGSGLINGLVECDTPHIIKGRIIKEKRTHTEANTNQWGDLTSTTLTETVSNKLIFNLLTPNGFVSLTDYDGGIFDDDDEDDPCDAPTARMGHSTSASSATETVTIDERLFKIKENVLTLGQVVMTPGVQEEINDIDISTALSLHRGGDWGNVSASDRKSNDYAVKHGERVVSSYKSADGIVFWIITERDRSYTTVLLPDEY